MGLNVEDIIAGLDPAERCKVEEMAAELIADERSGFAARMAGRSCCSRRNPRSPPSTSRGGDLGVTGSEIVELIREGRERYG